MLEILDILIKFIIIIFIKRFILVKSHGRFSKQSKQNTGSAQKHTVGSKNREISVLFRSLVRPLLEYANWPLKAYNVEHQELPLGKNNVRCHLKRDANYWAGARFSGVL